MNPTKRLHRQDLELVLERTAPLWEEARGQQIFITGGTGFFGCWLLESFCHINQALDLHAHVVVLTRDPAAFAAKCPHIASSSALTLHQGDIRSFVFPRGEFRFIVHAATDTSTPTIARAPLDTFSTVVRGTERVLQFGAACTAQKLLLTSSGAVYGPQPSTIPRVPESFLGGPNPVDCSNAYGESKRTAELLCSLYSERVGLECKIARCWAFCGPHLRLDQHFAIGNFIGDVLAGRPIQILGDGTPRRSYLYAADLAIWLWTILFRAPALVPFNVGSARDVSIHELAQIVAATLRPETEIRIARAPIPGAEPLRYVPSVDRACTMLGLREEVTLEAAIRKTAEWYAG